MKPPDRDAVADAPRAEAEIQQLQPTDDTVLSVRERSDHLIDPTTSILRPTIGRSA